MIVMESCEDGLVALAPVYRLYRPGLSLSNSGPNPLNEDLPWASVWRLRKKVGRGLFNLRFRV